LVPEATRVAYRSTDENAGYIRVVNADGSGDHRLAGPGRQDQAAELTITLTPPGAKKKIQLAVSVVSSSKALP
jgi:hypothetical protein